MFCVLRAAAADEQPTRGAKERGSRACPRLPLVRSTPPTGSAGAAQRFGLTSGASGGPLVPEGTCLGCDVPVCWAEENLSFLFLYSPPGGTKSSRWSALPRPGAARGLLNDSVGQERGSQREVFGATPLALVVSVYGAIGEREENEVMAGRAAGRRRNHIPYQQCAWVVGLRSSMYARHLR